MMYRLKIIFSILLFIASTSVYAQFGKLVDKAKSTVSNGSTSGANPSEIATALKQALEIGASKSADLLSTNNGFFGNQAVKILFPPAPWKKVIKSNPLKTKFKFNP